MSKELEALRKIGSLSTQTYTENGTSVTLTSQLVKDNCEYKIVEKALTELDELKCDVARYFDLGHIEVPSTEQFEEYLKLTEKLLKVGKEDV